MTPAEHYKEAERWIALAEHLAQHGPLTPHDPLLPAYECYLRRAQVHATLATAWPSTVCTCKPVLTMSGMEREVVDGCPIHGGSIEQCMCLLNNPEPDSSDPRCPIHGQAPEDDTSGVGMFPCPVCGRRFRTGAQVLDHSIAAHTEDS